VPSTSKKQHNFMAAVANNPKFAKKVGVSKTVGEEFMKADKGRKFKQGGALKETDAETNPGLAKLPTEVRNKMGYMKKGGAVKHSDMAKDKPMMKKVAKEEVKAHEKAMHGMKKGGMCEPKKMAKGGSIDGCAVRGKTKGTMVKMYGGGKC
jgi:hypothetical protein